ncbi:hypothetical protein FS837_010362 [Tulasnella sp. UAMH 9824]|nr:hypothetical protein FS837_010362 [Tulasnella sp. UAMH 9824]
MDTTTSTEPAEKGLDPLVTDSLAAIVAGRPEAEAASCLNFGGPYQAKSSDWTAQLSTTPPAVVAGNDVAATSTQNQQLSPIDVIPLELFQVTIWEVMKEYLRLSIPEYYYALTRIRLVCRRWSGILEAMPEIWANLSLSMDERLIDLALSRSTHCPLTITGPLFASRGLDKLLQNTYRWRILDVFVAMDGTMDRLALHSVPLLQELSLDTPVPTPHMTLFNGSAPMLRSACIQSYGVQWSTSLFSNLHELVLVNITAAAPDVDTLLETLSNSPKLTRLLIHSVIFTIPPPSQTRISLSCLRSLELAWLAPHILEQLVDAIDIPTSTKCSFSIVLDDGWHIRYERLEIIGPRLKALAEVSRGTKSTLTFKIEMGGWTWNVRTIYEGEAE